MLASDRRTAPATTITTWQWFLLSAAVPLIHCASRLNLDLWHDEIYTVEYFVCRGPAFIVTDYSAPNNHPLYSLALWPFYCLSVSNVLLRFPSLLCTAGTLAAVFALAKQLRGLSCAVLATALLGLNQMFLIFTMQVRGYGLSMFLAALVAWLAMSDVLAGWRRAIALMLGGAGLLYVMPTNLLFFAPLALVACCVRRSTARQFAGEVAIWSSAAALAFLCYLPIIGQVRAAAASASQSTWSYLPVIAGNFFRPATHDFVWLAPLFAAGLVAWAYRQVRYCRLSLRVRASFRGAQGNDDLTLPLISLVVIAGAYLLTALLRLSPFERNYCPLLIFLALAEGWLLTELADAVRDRWSPQRSSEAATVIVLAIASLVLWPQLWTYADRLERQRSQHTAADPLADGYYCYYAADYRPSDLVRYLIDSGIERSTCRVCFTHVDHLNLIYYFAQLGLPPSAGDEGKTTGNVALFAAVPEPPPWKRLAEDCKLTARQVESFHLVGDFGYYRLYEAGGTER